MAQLPCFKGSWAIYPPFSFFDIDGATQDSAPSTLSYEYIYIYTCFCHSQANPLIFQLCYGLQSTVRTVTWLWWHNVFGFVVVPAREVQPNATSPVQGKVHPQNTSWQAETFVQSKRRIWLNFVSVFFGVNAKTDSCSKFTFGKKCKFFQQNLMHSCSFVKAPLNTVRGTVFATAAG